MNQSQAGYIEEVYVEMKDAGGDGMEGHTTAELTRLDPNEINLQEAVEREGAITEIMGETVKE